MKRRAEEGWKFRASDFNLNFKLKLPLGALASGRQARPGAGGELGAGLCRLRDLGAAVSPHRTHRASALPVFALVLANAALGFHALMEGWGGRRLFLTVIFLGVLPPMTGFILGTTSNARMPLGIWLAALSPASGTVLAPAVMVPDADLPREVARAIPRAFWFCQTLFLLGLGWLLLKLRAIHRARHASVGDNPLPAAAGPATSPTTVLAE